MTALVDPIALAHENWTQRWGSSPPMVAATSLMRVHQILLSRVNEVLKPWQLSFARYELLVLLSFSSTGALPLGLLGRRLMVHPTSVTSTVRRLEAQALVVRRSDPNDRRVVLAQITEQGRGVLEEATPALVRAEFGAERYTEAEQWAIHDLLVVLRARAGDMPWPSLVGQADPNGTHASPTNSPTHQNHDKGHTRSALCHSEHRNSRTRAPCVPDGTGLVEVACDLTQ